MTEHYHCLYLANYYVLSYHPTPAVLRFYFVFQVLQFYFPEDFRTDQVCVPLNVQSLYSRPVNQSALPTFLMD